MLHKIREIAKAKGITLADLEKEAGLKKKTIFTWDRSIPSVDKAYRVAQVLGTTVEDLLSP